MILTLRLKELFKIYFSLKNTVFKGSLLQPYFLQKSLIQVILLLLLISEYKIFEGF